MRSISASKGCAVVALFSGMATACSTISQVTTTFYGYPDNSPPGPGTAYNCGGRNYIAGGILPSPGAFAVSILFAKYGD
jgi:hypothetical protein